MGRLEDKGEAEVRRAEGGLGSNGSQLATVRAEGEGEGEGKPRLQDCDHTGVDVPKTELSQEEKDSQLRKMTQFFSTDSVSAGVVASAVSNVTHIYIIIALAFWGRYSATDRAAARTHISRDRERSNQGHLKRTTQQQNTSKTAHMKHTGTHTWNDP